MIQDKLAHSSEADEISFSDLLAFLARNIFLILACAIGCMLAAGAAAWILPSKYEGVVLLATVNSQSASSGLGGLASAVSQLGGVASLAGLNVSAASSSKAEAIATLQSQIISEKFIEDSDLLPLLFSKKWNSISHKWASDDPKEIPSLWQGMTFFQKQVLNVSEITKTGLVALTVTWDDPKVAAIWANDIVKLTNSYLQQKAIQESKRNIEYLTEQASRTASVEVKNAIYTVMETEIKKEMVARGSEEYALKILDPAIPPERPVTPRPKLWIFGGFVIGLVFGVAIAVFRTSTRQGPILSARVLNS